MKLGDRVQVPVSLRDLADVFGWATFDLAEWAHYLPGADLSSYRTPNENAFFEADTRKAPRGLFTLRGRACGTSELEAVDLALRPGLTGPDAMADGIAIVQEGLGSPVALRDVVRSLPIPLKLVRSGGAS